MANLIQEKKLSLDIVKNYYFKNCKPKNAHKIGLEYERIAINSIQKKVNLANILEITKEFSKKNNWKLIHDGDTLIGAKNGATSISVEPGGQFEISLAPKKEICEIHTELTEFLNKIKNITKKYNIEFLNLGLNPYQTYDELEILPKSRYLIMAKYFGNKFPLAHAMMRETAGIQVNIDYESEEDAVLKFNFLNKIMPFLTALCANSEIRNYEKTAYKSFRAYVWKNTDYERCGDFLLKIKNFEDYIEKIINIPMLFIEKNGEKITLEEKITFKNYMENGYNSSFPDLNEYLNHSSLAFPDIRLKNSIEIRNHDSNSPEYAVALCAFYKGLLADYEQIKILDKKLNLNEKQIAKLGHLASKFGTEFDIKEFLPNFTIDTLLNELLNISKNNLCLEERDFLSIIEEKIQSI